VRVLVTGGAGYIGSILVPLLLGRGHRVTVFDRLVYGAEGLAPCRTSPGFELIAGDLRDPDALRRAVPGAEAMLHLAAVSGYPACAKDPQTASGVNVQGTANLLAAAGGLRPVVLASSLSCYGSVPEGRCDERTPARPVSHYGRTKLEAEALVLGSPFGIVLRLATVYGLSPRLRLDLLVNAFVHTLARGEPLQVYEPEARRAFLHVTDAARAFLLALENSDSLAGGIYNVGEETQALRKRELVERIRQRFPDSRVSYSASGKDEDRRDYAVSFARFRGRGFRAATSLEQGIDELARAFRRGAPRLEDLQGSAEPLH
jgi:nucleoside-diphosphate-sugar epimerase